MKTQVLHIEASDTEVLQSEEEERRILLSLGMSASEVDAMFALRQGLTSSLLPASQEPQEPSHSARAA